MDPRSARQSSRASGCTRSPYEKALKDFREFNDFKGFEGFQDFKDFIGFRSFMDLKGFKNILRL